MTRVLLALVFTLAGLPAYAQQWDQVNGSMQVKSGPTAPLVIIDQTQAGQKIASFRSAGTEKCYIDVSGNLNCAGTFTLTGQFLAGDGTAGAPSYSFASAPTYGMYLESNVPRIALAGVEKYRFGTAAGLSLLDNAAAIYFGASEDTCVQRGAASRIDVCTGDSLYVVSGGLGVGAAPGAAGTVATSGAITSASGLFVNNGSSGNIGWTGQTIMRSAANGKWTLYTNDAATGALSEQFTDNPTCATNCGTSPTLAGVDSSFTLTMGASGSPASGFVVTFNGTWAAAPQCTSVMGKTGMAVGKLPMVIVTTTTTATVTTNGTAPATTDIYHFRCSLGQ